MPAFSFIYLLNFVRNALEHKKKWMRKKKHKQEEYWKFLNGICFCSVKIDDLNNYNFAIVELCECLNHCIFIIMISIVFWQVQWMFETIVSQFPLSINISFRRMKSIPSLCSISRLECLLENGFLCCSHSRS